MAGTSRASDSPSSIESLVANRPEYVVALLGNPNVGKSTLFNQLTGLGVVTAHYAGKTEDVNVGTTRIGDTKLTVMDLPGTYGLAGNTEEAWVSRRTIYDVEPDVVIVVLDATNLSRNLVLALEVLDLGLPTVLVANLSDEAARKGASIDSVVLSERLGAPVFETTATEGIGVAAVMEYVALVARGEVVLNPPDTVYGDPFERTVRPLVHAVDSAGLRPFGVAPRASALRLLANDPEFRTAFVSGGSAGIVRVAEEARTALRAVMGEGSATVLVRERHGAAGVIAQGIPATPSAGKRRVDLARLATRPITGVPVLMAMLLGLFLLLFFVGETLAGLVSSGWVQFVSPVVQAGVHGILGEGTAARTILWGLDAGLEASFAIGIPYILTFYFLLAMLEDTGYLNAVAFLADRMMHHAGLHGRAVIPIVAGLGCSVPAILSVRLLSTKRERFIAATLISMVPCSARTAVILGAVGHFIGIWPALGVYAITALVAAGVGIALDRLLPGTSGGMVMEMFPFRRPAARIVARKAWSQFREFLFVATPIVVIGSIVLGGLYETGWLWKLADPMSPIITGWLGLPAVAGLTLLFGLLRKEFALQLLATLAIATMGAGFDNLLSFMSQTDVFVYVLVNTLAIPCVSTVAVLGKVLGWRRAASVTAVTVTVALLVGGLFARLLPLLGVPA